MVHCIHAIGGLKGGFVSRRGKIFFFVSKEEKGEGKGGGAVKKANGLDGLAIGNPCRVIRNLSGK
jgi:hypothetical protein